MQENYKKHKRLDALLQKGIVIVLLVAACLPILQQKPGKIFRSGPFDYDQDRE